jgi:hypothetical protein
MAGVLFLLAAGAGSPESGSAGELQPESGSQLDAEVVYEADDGSTLAICACAKCGTTSVFEWMYESAFDEPWNASHDELKPPWVQDLDAWGQPKVGRVGTSYVLPAEGATGRAGGLELLQIVRDPLERYASAFRSKVGCSSFQEVGFQPKVKELQGLSDVDIEEVRRDNASGFCGDTHSAAYAAYAGCTPGEPICLSFASYARMLRRVHAQGKQADLNPHLLPQSLLGCQAEGSRRVTAEQFAAEAGRISTRLHLHVKPFPRSHSKEVRSRRRSESRRRREADEEADEEEAVVDAATLADELCAVARTEYLWLGGEYYDAFKERCFVNGKPAYKPLTSEETVSSVLRVCKSQPCGEW